MIVTIDAPIKENKIYVNTPLSILRTDLLLTLIRDNFTIYKQTKLNIIMTSKGKAKIKMAFVGDSIVESVFNPIIKSVARI